MKQVVDSAAAVKVRKKRRRSLDTRHVPWAYAIPSVLLMVLGRLVASAIGAYYSFTDWTGLTLKANWVGLANYVRLFTDKTMSGAVWHTIVIAFLMVVLSNIFGLLLALLLQQKFKLRTLYRALFFLPFALSYLATGYVWQFILSFKGPFNQFLSLIGLEQLQRV